jgi:hypothetical protein
VNNDTLAMACLGLAALLLVLIGAVVMALVTHATIARRIDAALLPWYDARNVGADLDPVRSVSELLADDFDGLSHSDSYLSPDSPSLL